MLFPSEIVQTIIIPNVSSCFVCDVIQQKIGNGNPLNEKAQSRVYALWTFAKAYVADKDRVAVDGGKGAEIKASRVESNSARPARSLQRSSPSPLFF